MTIIDILTIIGMLLGAAALGFLIGWFLNNNKIEQLKGYIVSMEDKVNRVQSEKNINEKMLIDCQTERKKLESDKNKIEKILADCQGKLIISELDTARLKPEIDRLNQEMLKTEKLKIENDRLHKEILETKAKTVVKEKSGKKAKPELKAKSEKREKPELRVVNKKTIEKKNQKKPDNDLTIIEGIGPIIAGILNKAGTNTFRKLSRLNTEKISELLVKAGGNRYNRFDPTTWSRQALLAAEGKYDELKQLQAEMKAGRL